MHPADPHLCMWAPCNSSCDKVHFTRIGSTDRQLLQSCSTGTQQNENAAMQPLTWRLLQIIAAPC